jgi:hypothetical protein
MKYKIMVNDQCIEIDNVRSVEHRDMGIVGFFDESNVLLFEAPLNKVDYIQKLTTSKTLRVEIKSNYPGKTEGMYGKWEWAASSISESVEKAIAESSLNLPDNQNELTIQVIYV